jgi:hypothetical protein
MTGCVWRLGAQPLAQWEAKVRHDLQSTNPLSGNSFGALTSIAYI